MPSGKAARQARNAAGGRGMQDFTVALYGVPSRNAARRARYFLSRARAVGALRRVAVAIWFRVLWR